MNTNWFTSRNLRVLEYQQNAITKVQQSLNEHEITVLAACPSAGKTLMTIYMIEEYLRQNPNHNILVLTHGTTVLRTQFHDVLEKYKPNFTYALIESCKDYQNSSASVNVCLPQSLHKCQLKKADLLICDEAHQFYFAKMVKKIINDTKVKKQLLLTGTPSQFILNKHIFTSIIPVALNTIFDAGMVNDVYIEIASSTYNFDLKDYNEYDELKSSVHFNNSDTKKTLDALVTKIDKRLKSIRNFRYTNLTPEWLPVLKTMEKTMMVCKSQAQAKQVQNYFNKIGVISALSISDTDKDSSEIQRFKDEKDVLVLIVVGRGILGFNFEELVNVLDMTVSHNVDRLYQLFCRVVRKHPNGNKKLYFKIAPNMLTDYFKHIMTATMMLTQEEFFVKFNGKNFNDMEIPVKKVGKRNNTNPDPNNKSKKRQKKYQPIDMEGLPVFQLFKNILHKKDELLSPYAMTTVRDVRAEFMNVTPPNYWTLEKCIESGSHYNTIRDWRNGDSFAYNAALRNDWIGMCCKHMEILRRDNYWNLNLCLESALKYNRIVDWEHSDNKYDRCAYKYASRNKEIFIKCIAHMDVARRPKITKEICIADAKKYNRIVDWQKSKDGSSYNAALKNGWLEEATKHMKRMKPMGFWNIKENVLADALKYEEVKIWQKNNATAYGAARKNSWFEEATKHMKRMKPKNYWSVKENVLADALNYNTRSEWMRSNGSAYIAALRNGWIDEATNHMISNKKPNGYWNDKEKCLNVAKKCKNKSEFAKHSAVCRAALKNGWYDECIALIKKEEFYFELL